MVNRLKTRKRVLGSPFAKKALAIGLAAVVGALVVFAGFHAVPSVEAARNGKNTKVRGEPQMTEYVILAVLEGVGEQSLKSGPMPVVSRFVKEGAVTWSATNPTPSLRLPSMASIITGLPVEKHGVEWDRFDFARGYPRPPTLFDYLDLSGGKDSAIFFMDESLSQLAKPAPYTDYQMCGPLKPECSPETIVKYIRDYLRKAASDDTHGHLVEAIPHLLLVHLPEAGRVGQAKGWASKEYRHALKAVDKAVGAVVNTYREMGLLTRTTVIVTALNPPGSLGSGREADMTTQVPWIAWGYGIKPGHKIKQKVSLLDTGATVMRTFGLETYTEWESQPVEEVFTSSRSGRRDDAAKARR